MIREARLRAFRPRAEAEVEPEVRGLAAALRDESALSPRAPWLLRAADGTVLLLVEWASPQAERRAEDNPRVNAAMADLEAVAEEIALDELDEASALVAAFESLSP